LHEYRTFQNMIFYLLKKDIPYVIHLHGELLYKKEKLDVFLLRRIYENLLAKKFLNHASRIFALTDYEFSQLINLGFEKRNISIVPNAVSPDRFINKSQKNKFKKYFNNEDDRIILYVGRIYKYKGLDTLLEAFYYLSKKYNDIKLIIVGPDWGYLRYLINMIKHYDLKNKVIFTGVLDGELLSAAYNEASVVVNPSMQEGFPTILLEAGLFSKPIILTDNPSIYSFKKNNLCITIEYRNVNQLQKALTKVLENPKKHRYIGKKLHDYVNQNFTWKKVSKDIESLYYDIIKVN
ncbi:MAG: glycosyltransferase family 4 protein, partial [Candidatus Hodarchaeota archaeon]